MATRLIMRHTIIEKSRRRLLVLSMGTLFVLMFGGGLFALNQWQNNKQYQLTRQDVQLAMQQGRYGDAIELVTRALAFWPDDSLLLEDYVKAQKHVEYLSEQNLAMTIEVLNRSLHTNPQMLQAAGQLVQMHIASGDAMQGVHVADIALKAQPDNVPLLKNRALAYIRVGNLEMAVEDINRCIALTPTDYDLYLLRLYLGKRQNLSADQMVEMVARWHETLTTDAWYQALMGVTCRLNGLDDQARQWLTQAASGKHDDVRLLQLLIKQLDHLGRYELADQLLDDADADQLPGIRYEKAWRLWQQKADQSLLKLDHQDQQAVIALQILACKRAGQTQRIDTLLLRFSEMPPTTGNRHWLKLMHLLAKDQNVPALQLIETSQQVRLNCLNHDLADLVLAQQYERLGEKFAALDIWHAISDTSPRWILPHLQQARLLLETDHPMAAANAARAALACDDKNMDAGVLLIESLAKSNRVAAREMAMVLLEQLSASLSTETRLLLEARLLDVKTVADHVALAITLAENWSDKTWLELAQISLDRQGNWHDHCLDVYLKHTGQTPQWLLLKALAIKARGQDVAARELVNQTLASQIKHNPKDVKVWELAGAQYLAASSDMLSNHVMWKHLLDTYPDDLMVCRAFFNQQMDRIEPQLRLQAIDQLQRLTGPMAIRWRYEKAALIYKQASDNVSLSQVATLLHEALKRTPSDINCRLLLMQCLQSIGSEQGVIEQADAILHIDPYHEKALEIRKQAGR
jgi:tetratricopeptide (TPR) repeat protein